MKTFFILLTLLFSIQSFANCEMTLKKLNLCLSWKFLEAPVSGKYVKAAFRFSPVQNPSENIVPEGTLKIDLWMPMMGHGSRPLVITSDENHSYTADKIYFMMSGAWLVRVKLLGPSDAVIDEAQMEVEI